MRGICQDLMREGGVSTELGEHVNPEKQKKADPETNPETNPETKQNQNHHSTILPLTKLFTNAFSIFKGFRKPTKPKTTKPKSEEDIKRNSSDDSRRSESPDGRWYDAEEYARDF